MSAQWYPPPSPPLPSPSGSPRLLPCSSLLRQLPALHDASPRAIALARLVLFGVILLIAGLPISDALAANAHQTSTGKRRLDASKKKAVAKKSSKATHRKAVAASTSKKRNASRAAASRHATVKGKPAKKAMKNKRASPHAKAVQRRTAPKSAATGTAQRRPTPEAAAAKAPSKQVGIDAKPRLLARCGFTAASRKRLFSRAVYIVDEKTRTPLFARNADQVRPIASLTKLMTAVVWLDGDPAMRAPLSVTNADLDTLKFTHSRLAVGSTLSRADMLHISLMASENRAAAALSRDYPGGRTAFINAMNAKARALNMPNTRFENSTGLSPRNVSTARELARLVRASNGYPLIRRYSIDRQKKVHTGKGQLQYVNTNRLVRYGKVHASVQKTGFINESGHNMVMRVMVHKRRPVIVTMLGSDTPEGSRLDGVRIAHWLSCSLK